MGEGRRLWELDVAVNDALARLSVATSPEEIEAADEELNELLPARDEKWKAYIFRAENLDLEAGAHEGRAAVLREMMEAEHSRAKILQNEADRMRMALFTSIANDASSAAQARGRGGFALGTYRIKASPPTPSVGTVDLDAIPNNLLRYPQPEPKKNEIIALWKAYQRALALDELTEGDRTVIATAEKVFEAVTIIPGVERWAIKV